MSADAVRGIRPVNLADTWYSTDVIIAMIRSLKPGERAPSFSDFLTTERYNLAVVDGWLMGQFTDAGLYAHIRVTE